MSDTKKTKLEVTSAPELKRQREAREEGEMITLDSGVTVRIRRPNTAGLIRRGIIPAQLAHSAINYENPNSKNKTKEDLEAYFEVQRIVARVCLAYPKIVEDGKEPDYEAGEAKIEDFTDDDINEIYLYSQGGMDNLIRFRAQRQGVLAALNK